MLFYFQHPSLISSGLERSPAMVPDLFYPPPLTLLLSSDFQAPSLSSVRIGTLLRHARGLVSLFFHPPWYAHPPYKRMFSNPPAENMEFLASGFVLVCAYVSSLSILVCSPAIYMDPSSKLRASLPVLMRSTFKTSIRPGTLLRHIHGSLLQPANPSSS